MSDIATSTAALPAVPLTLEGASVLHQMVRFQWSRWKALDKSERSKIAREAAEALAAMEKREGGNSGLFSILGHKGDLMFVHFRPDFVALKQAELELGRLAFWDFVDATTSYLSVVELGLYESSIKTYHALADRGIQPFTPDWDAEIEAVMSRQREAMRSRLFPDVPPHRYICFYPMDRKRGEDKNWYQVPMAERQRMMHEHGMIGRRYAGDVKQIITGSIGFDDWEWGVDLFADDPLVFKKLIYEMRFDEVSAVYALFGSFYVGIRCRAEDLEGLLIDGRVPASSNGNG